MPGVRIFHFSLPGINHAPPLPIPVIGRERHFEILFCLGGHLTLHPKQKEPYTVSASELLLLSDVSSLHACQCTPDFSGIFVAVDAQSARASLFSICAIMGINLDISAVKEKMKVNCGCLVISGTPWAQALFQTLLNLSSEAQDCYCTFKSVELLYLLCSKIPVAEQQNLLTEGYVPQCIGEITSYMQTHLGEKLTIPSICKQFSVSSTYLKEWFHHTHGLPIHSWLIQQRMKRAHDLICTSKLPIHQIALAVGYGGSSQFNTAFKRYFDMTPTQLRKMSEKKTVRPF